MTGGRELAARLVVGLAGPEPTARERAWLRHWRPSGIILFARNITGPAQTARLCGELHAILPDLEIMADHEGGPVAPLSRATGRPPAAWGLGLLGDTDLTEAVHAATGARLAALGVDRVLAPVADVLTALRNPVIGVRAFGAEAGPVGRQVAAAVAGLRRGGVAVCLKHWPGHGGTDTDSHLEPSALAGKPSTEPFRAGLAAGADAVMLGHLHGRSGLPATLDAAVAEAVRGLDPAPRLLFTDDVTMGALRTPLAARGVAVPAGEGLVAPEDLECDWFAALASTGSDRLFVRGIPWSAFPLENEVPMVPAPVRDQDDPEPDPDPSWTEVWQRLRAELPADHAEGRPDLLWLDRTAGDRWGPADGTGACLVPDPGAVFGRVAASADQAGGPSTRLLITSHRPLDRSAERRAGWRSGLASAGLALAVGHPALADDVKALIPSGWRVAYLPEWRL